MKFQEDKMSHLVLESRLAVSFGDRQGPGGRGGGFLFLQVRLAILVCPFCKNLLNSTVFKFLCFDHAVWLVRS